MCISFTEDPFFGEPDGALAHLVGAFNGALTDINMAGSSIGKGKLMTTFPILLSAGYAELLCILIWPCMLTKQWHHISS